MFDGPVDAVWIESMNTVLDDNKKLCLSSGKVLNLSNLMKMIFEVEDLEVASPATVSRCGMVYLEPEGLGLHPLIQSWIIIISQQLKDAKLIQYFNQIIKNYLFQCIDYIDNKTKYIYIMKNNICNSFLKLMDCFLNYYQKQKGANYRQFFEDLVLYSIVWSCGAVLQAGDRIPFNNFLLALIEQNNVNNKLLTATQENKESTVFDFNYDKENFVWVQWIE